MSIDKNSFMNGDAIITMMSDNLAMLRAKSTLTQAEIADVIGIPRTTYSAIECGRRKMTFNVFLKLAKFFSENDKTSIILSLLGLDNETLTPILKANSIIENSYKEAQKKIVAFGGTIQKDDEKQTIINKALRGIDKN